MGSRRGDPAGWVRDGKAVWLARLPALGSDRWIFRRGIPAGVSYRHGEVAELLHDAPLVFLFPTVQTIELDCMTELKGPYDYEQNCGTIPTAEAQALADLHELQWVRELRLRRANLPRPQWDAILTSPHLKRLAVLDLGGSHIPVESLSTLLGSPSASCLKILRLTGELFLAESDAGGYSTQTYDRVQASVSDEMVAILAESPRLAGLLELDLSGNCLNRVAVDSLRASPHLPRDLRLRVGPRATQDPLNAESLRLLRERFPQVEG